MGITLYRRGTTWTTCSCDPYDEAIRLRDHEMVRICATCGKIIGLVGVAGEVCPCHCITHGTCGKCGEAALAKINAQIANGEAAMEKIKEQLDGLR